MNDITETEMTQRFSHNLKQLRYLRTPPVTQQQLANRLHVDRGLIAKYERGMLLPSVCLAFNMARFFDISMEKLLTGTLGMNRRENEFENITPYNQKNDPGRKIQTNG